MDTPCACTECQQRRESVSAHKAYMATQPPPEYDWPALEAASRTVRELNRRGILSPGHPPGTHPSHGNVQPK